MIMKFAELFEEFVKVKGLEVRPSSLSLYRLNWKGLSSLVSEYDISEFGKREARFVLASIINEGIQPKTAKDRMAFLKQMICWAALELEIGVKSTDWGLKFPKSKPRLLKNFTEPELIRLVAKATSEIYAGNYNILPILISVLTGMRMGEVLGLQWKDIDFVHNQISVERQAAKYYDPEQKKEIMLVAAPKTQAAYRTIPVIGVLRKVLRFVGGKNPNPDFFVVGNSETPKVHNTIRETYARFLKRSKLPSINFHGLRHTYATRLVESGGDIKTISILLGHTNVATTMNLYVHPSDESKRKVCNKAFRKLKESLEI